MNDNLVVVLATTDFRSKSNSKNSSRCNYAVSYDMLLKLLYTAREYVGAGLYTEVHYGSLTVLCGILRPRLHPLKVSEYS